MRGSGGRKSILTDRRRRHRAHGGILMKIRVVVLLIAATMLTGPAIGQDEHVAIFKNISGPVRVVRSDADLTAVNGMALMTTDKVVSGADASGGIVFKDGTLLTIGSFTEVAIRDYVFEPKDSKYAFSLYLAK